MIESIKPKTARKTAVWKLRKDFLPQNNVTALKLDNVLARTAKEPKITARITKNPNITKLVEGKPTPVRQTTTVRITKDEKTNKIVTPQSGIVQTVIQDSNQTQNVEASNDTQVVHVQSPVFDKNRTIIRATDLKNITKTITKTARPSIIKKALIKETIPSSSAAPTVVVSIVFAIYMTREHKFGRMNLTII